MSGEILKDTFSSDESFDDEEEDSELDSEVDAKLAEDDVFDVEFLKCYSALKKKDEKIYDKNVRFFDDDHGSSSDETSPKNDKTQNSINTARTIAPKMTLLDLQLKTVADDSNEVTDPKIDLSQDVSKSYYEKELQEIKKSIEQVGEEIDDSDDDLLVVKNSDSSKDHGRAKNKISNLLDKIVDEDGEDLEHLKQVWSDPKSLSKEDRYLRDYILNKRYLPSNVNTEEDDTGGGFFSKNLEGLSDVESDQDSPADSREPTRHSDEQGFDKIARIPRNSTKTIRDMVEKQEKREKRAKKLEKEKKKKKKIADADCEDIIGELPTKFHYRETEANDFGLTAEELLMATDEELDKWVNLHECVAYKTREEELEQKRKFDALRGNIELKRKIFKSVYGDEQPGDESQVAESKSSKKKRSRKRKRDVLDDELTEVINTSDDIPSATPSANDLKKEKKKKNRRRGLNHKKFAKVGVAPDRLLAYGLSKTKLKKKKLL